MPHDTHTSVSFLIVQNKVSTHCILSSFSGEQNCCTMTSMCWFYNMYSIDLSCFGAPSHTVYLTATRQYGHRGCGRSLELATPENTITSWFLHPQQQETDLSSFFKLQINPKRLVYINGREKHYTNFST